jgi:uncharacterized protein (DUF3820 family)
MTKYTIETLMKFGKYKNKPLSSLLKDDNYKNWILKQEWFKIQNDELFKFLKNYIEPKKTNERKNINFQDLPNDIKQLIFTKRYEIMKEEKQAQIDEKIKEYPHVYKCSKCNKNEYHKFPICNFDICGNCTNKEHDRKMKEHKNYLQSNKCNCGKYKKSGYAMCYNCNKKCLCPIKKAVMYRGYDLGYNPY